MHQCVLSIKQKWAGPPGCTRDDPCKAPRDGFELALVQPGLQFTCKQKECPLEDTEKPAGARPVLLGWLGVR